MCYTFWKNSITKQVDALEYEACLRLHRCRVQHAEEWQEHGNALGPAGEVLREVKYRLPFRELYCDSVSIFSSTIYDLYVFYLTHAVYRVKSTNQIHPSWLELILRSGWSGSKFALVIARLPILQRELRPPSNFVRRWRASSTSTRFATSSSSWRAGTSSCTSGPPTGLSTPLFFSDIPLKSRLFFRGFSSISVDVLGVIPS